MIHSVNRPSLGGLCSVKLAFHAHDRMEERTPFHRSYTNQLQLAVDTLKLTGEAYHLPLRDNAGKVVGYAQFKRVPDRKSPRARHRARPGDAAARRERRGDAAPEGPKEVVTPAPTRPPTGTSGEGACGGGRLIPYVAMARASCVST